MYRIDLLKGQGIPLRSRPEGIAIASVTIVVPAIVAIGMLGVYLHSKIMIGIQRQKMARMQVEIDKLSEALELRQGLQQQRNEISKCLSEVRSSIGRHTQWSSVLQTVVENLPESVVLTGLQVSQRFIRKRAPSKGGSQKKQDIMVPVRTLHMSVSGSAGAGCSKQIKDFRERLLRSSCLGWRLQDIRVSQRSGTGKDEELITFEIDCIFKQGL